MIVLRILSFLLTFIERGFLSQYHVSHEKLELPKTYGIETKNISVTSGAGSWTIMTPAA